MKLVLLTILFTVFLSFTGMGQTSAIEKKIFKVMNEARSNPAAFFNNHKTELSKYDTVYYLILTEIPAQKALILDPNLNLDGEGSVYGVSVVSYMSIKRINDLTFFASACYRYIHDPSITHVGIQDSPKDSSTVVYFGRTSMRNGLMPFSYNNVIDSSGVNFSLLNSGKNITYMNDIEKSFVQEINYTRVYPQVYLQLLSQYLSNFDKEYGGIPFQYYCSWLAYSHYTASAPLVPDSCIYKALTTENTNPLDYSVYTQQRCPHLSDNSNVLVYVNDINFNTPQPRELTIRLLLENGRYNVFLDPEWKYIGAYSGLTPIRNWVSWEVNVGR